MFGHFSKLDSINRVVHLRSALIPGPFCLKGVPQVSWLSSPPQLVASRTSSLTPTAASASLYPVISMLLLPASSVGVGRAATRRQPCACSYHFSCTHFLLCCCASRHCSNNFIPKPTTNTCSVDAVLYRAPLGSGSSWLYVDRF
jgi:hypothetical protein